jgi:beta-xylosidase
MINQITVISFILAATAFAKLVLFDNTRPRFDNAGNIVNAHDGSIQKFKKDGPYYIHAAEYGLCKEPARYGCDQTPDHCGFQNNHNITIFKSYDLSSGSWQHVGNAIDVKDRPEGIVFRPHAVYNPIFKEYVLYWNYVAAGTYAGYAAASSKSPEGPFIMRNKLVNVTRAGAGDFDIFIDDDGTGYIIYDNQDHWMGIEQLTPDLLYSTGKKAICNPGAADPYFFSTPFVEAPVMFKRNGTYYALFSHCCCYCYQGSGIRVHTAPHPMGPWTIQDGGDIACKKADSFTFRAEPTPGQGCQYGDPTTTATVRAQQNFVVQVDTPKGTEYVWTGDRWQQAPDGIKGHEPQTWIPLHFNSDGSISFVDWVDKFVLDVV